MRDLAHLEIELISQYKIFQPSCTGCGKPWLEVANLKESMCEGETCCEAWSQVTKSQRRNAEMFDCKRTNAASVLASEPLTSLNQAPAQADYDAWFDSQAIYLSMTDYMWETSLVCRNSLDLKKVSLFQAEIWDQVCYFLITFSNISMWVSLTQTDCFKWTHPIVMRMSPLINMARSYWLRLLCSHCRWARSSFGVGLRRGYWKFSFWTIGCWFSALSFILYSAR